MGQYEFKHELSCDHPVNCLVVVVRDNGVTTTCSKCGRVLLPGNRVSEGAEDVHPDSERDLMKLLAQATRGSPVPEGATPYQVVSARLAELQELETAILERLASRKSPSSLS